MHLGHVEMMKKNSFIILCLRLMGIYFGVLGLSSLPNMIAIFLESSSSQKYFLISPLFLIVSGVVLVIFAPKLSHFIIGFSETEETSFYITASEKTTRIALLVLGVFIFAQTLPQFIQISIDVGLYYSNIDEVPKHLRYVQPRWTYLIGPIVKLIISAVLIIGSDKIIGFIARYDQTFKRLKSSNNANEANMKKPRD
jgi:hypothetical protein